MIQRVLVLLVVVVVSGLALGARADDRHPCLPKADAKHDARKALHECIEAWAKDHRPGDADPADDCSAKLATFVAAAKDVKACRTAQKEAHSANKK